MFSGKCQTFDLEKKKISQTVSDDICLLSHLLFLLQFSTTSLEQRTLSTQIILSERAVTGILVLLSKLKRQKGYLFHD